MYDPIETYHNHQYRTGTRVDVLVRDRDYMNRQLSTILNGMPESVTHVGQIVKQEKRLKTILSNLGVFSTPYEQFMESTGQMKAG